MHTSAGCEKDATKEEAQKLHKNKLNPVVAASPWTWTCSVKGNSKSIEKDFFILTLDISRLFSLLL